MSDLIVFIYCLPAFLITCVMLFLAFLIKHKEAEKRVFERGALDGKASMEAHGETAKVSPVRSTSAQRKKLLDKRLKITAEGVALMRRTGEAFGEPCDRSGSSVRPAKRQSSGFIRQSHRALAERGRFGVTKTPRPNPQIRRGDEQRGAIRQRRKPSAQTQAIIDYVQQNK